MKRIFDNIEQAARDLRNRGAESYQYGNINYEDNTVALMGYDIYGVCFIVAYYRI